MGKGFMFFELEIAWYTVRFDNDSVEDIYIKDWVCDASGHTTLILSDDGTVYNFNKIISFKQKEPIDG